MNARDGHIGDFAFQLYEGFSSESLKSIFCEKDLPSA